MSDNNGVGGLTYKVSIDGVDEFVRGEKLTNDAQQRIIDKAEEVADATEKAEGKRVHAYANTSERTQKLLKGLGYEIVTQQQLEQERAKVTVESLDKVDKAQEKAAQNRRSRLSDEEKQQRQLADEERKRSQQERHDIRERNDQLRETRQIFSNVASSALGVFGLVTGARAIGSAYERTTEHDAARGRFAALNGSTPGRLNAFENAIGINGGNRDDAENTFASLQGVRQDIKLHGTSSRLPALFRLGVRNPLAPPEEILNQIHKTVMGMDRDVATGLMADAGIAADTQSLLISKDYDSRIAEGQARNSVNDKNTEDAQDRVRAAEQKRIEQETAFRNAIDKFGGWIVMFDHAVEAISGWFGGHPTATAIAGGLGTVAAGAATLAPLGLGTSAGRKATGSILRTGGRAAGWTAETLIGELLPAAMGAGIGYIAYQGLKSKTTADTSLPPEARGFLDQIAYGESSNNYASSYGGRPDLTSLAAHPHVRYSIGNGQTTSAAGRYQFEQKTWDSVAANLGLTDFSPQSQDQAAWYLAQDDYRRRTKRDLLKDLQEGGHANDIAAALHGTWTSLPDANAGIWAHAKYFNGLGNRTAFERASGGGARSGVNGSGPGQNIKIDNINIHTNSNDPKTHAQKVSQYLQSGQFVANAQRGLA